jgi:hypothetical protein
VHNLIGAQGPFRVSGKLTVVGQERGQRYVREHMKAGEGTLEPVEELGFVRGQERLKLEPAKPRLPASEELKHGRGGKRQCHGG